MSLEFVYSLHAGDFKHFYVGRTNDLDRRLKEHRASGNVDGTKKERHIALLLSQGKTIEMKMLDVGDADKMMHAEELWKVNLEAEGHELCNERAGDHHPYLGYSLASTNPTDWNASIISDAIWVRGDAKAKKGEWSTWVGATQFFRTGNKRLRFWHSSYGNWDVGGASIEQKYTNAAEMLTPGSPQNLKLVQQCQQVKRMAPRSYGG